MPKFSDDFFTQKESKKKFKPKKYRAWTELDNESTFNFESENNVDIKQESKQTQTKVNLKSNDSQTEVNTDSNQSQNEVKPKSKQTQTKVNLKSNDSQTEVNTDSNQSQNEVKPKSKQTQTKVNLKSNDSQTEVNTDSNQSQNEVKPKSKQTQTKVNLKSNDSQTEVNTDSNQSQNEVKQESNIANLSTFSPLSKLILDYIYSRTHHDNKRETDEIKIQDIAKQCHTTISGAKVTVQRLTKKSYIIRTMFKAGKFGWSKYKICNDLYKQIQTTKNPIETRVKEQNQFSIYNNTITTNKNNNPTDQKTDSTQNNELLDLIKKQSEQISELQKQQSQLNQPQSVEVKKDQGGSVEDVTATELNEDDWLDLDYSSLTEFGFKKSHVNQIKKFNAKLDTDSQLTVDSVQDSIEHYAWALRNKLSEMENYAPSTNRLRGLLGVLKKGGEWVEPNYKSPEDLAYEASLKAKKERLEKIKAQKDELFMLEFEMWRDGLSDEQLAEVEEKGKLKAAMPPSAFKNKGDNTYYVNALKSYYKKNEYKG